MKSLFSHLHFGELKDVAAGLLTNGASEEQVIASIVQVLDQLIDFQELIPGPVGAAVESLDGSIYSALAKIVVNAAKRRLAKGK